MLFYHCCWNKQPINNVAKINFLAFSQKHCVPRVPLCCKQRCRSVLDVWGPFPRGTRMSRPRGTGGGCGLCGALSGEWLTAASKRGWSFWTCRDVSNVWARGLGFLDTYTQYNTTVFKFKLKQWVHWLINNRDKMITLFHPIHGVGTKTTWKWEVTNNSNSAGQYIKGNSGYSLNLCFFF